MATWASLSQSDKDKILDAMGASRAWAGEMARLCALGRAIAAKYTGNVETALSGLDAGAIPVYDATQGQEQLTKAELINLVGYAMTSSETPDNSAGSYNTNYHRALFVKAAGLFNTLQKGQG
jgi:hypothetical protein